MHFYERDADCTQCVAEPDTGMGVGRGVDEDEVHPVLARLLDPFYQLTFVIRLEAMHLDACLRPGRNQTGINICQTFMPLVSRLASAQEIWVGPVNNDQVFVFCWRHNPACCPELLRF